MTEQNTTGNGWRPTAADAAPSKLPPGCPTVTISEPVLPGDVARVTEQLRRMKAMLEGKA